VRTLEFFAQKYREDQSFAQRVDASVTRILTLKYRMYSDFSLGTVVPALNLLARVGQSQQVSFDIASKAVTLLSPSPVELAQTLPKPPGLSDRIIFFTDNVGMRQCTQCTQTSLLAVDAMQSAVNKLYGPRAGGQVLIGNMFSYSLADLKLELDLNKDRLPKLEEDLKLANWIVLAVTQLQPGRTETQTVKRLLTDRPDLLQNKKIIMFAFGAPYYLDATDITKLSAFYAFYSKTPAFIEVAARVLSYPPTRRR
jgi:beta-N-acetylhexosaminidase